MGVGDHPLLGCPEGVSFACCFVVCLLFDGSTARKMHPLTCVATPNNSESLTFVERVGMSALCPKAACQLLRLDVDLLLNNNRRHEENDADLAVDIEIGFVFLRADWRQGPITGSATPSVVNKSPEEQPRVCDPPCSDPMRGPE
jgi:hypothetical protein